MVTRKSQRFGDARPADAPPGESGRSVSPPPPTRRPPGPGDSGGTLRAGPCTSCHHDPSPLKRLAPQARLPPGLRRAGRRLNWGGRPALGRISESIAKHPKLVC